MGVVGETGEREQGCMQDEGATVATAQGKPFPQNLEERRAASRRKRWFLLGGGAVLAALAIAALLYWLDARQYESTDDAFIDAQIVRIAPQVSGVVEELLVAPNRHVEPGELLVAIDPDTTQTLLSQQQAGLAQGAAQVGQAQSQIEIATSALTEALAHRQAQAALETKARKDLERLLAARRLDASAVAESQIDAARAQLTSARAEVASAQGEVNAARGQISSARDATRAADAARRAAQARVAQARLSLGQNRITAPIAGHIANIAVNKGSYVAPGTQMMALVPDEMWVTANYKETQLERIRPGQPVTMTVDAYPGVTFTGKVDSIQRGAGQAFQLLPPQNATGNFVKVVQRVPVRILFEGLDPERFPIGPGMSVVPKIKVR